MDILIAEDSEPSRTLLREILKKMDFNVIEANDGEDAWYKLQEPDSPKIVILDWLMPNLSGIKLTKKIREKDNSNGNYTYIIMVTSNSSKFANEGFNAGVDNYITKPINFETLSIALKIGRRIMNIHYELAFQLNKKKDEISRAQELQQILNTHKLPSMERVNLKAVYNPSQELGGDFFNIIKTARGNLATIVVDCTGHGLEASMYATLLKSVCDRHLYLLDNPTYLANFVQLVNIDIAGYITSDQFPVMFASVFDPESMKFYYSSANGEHPYLIRNKEVVTLARSSGIHLGYNTESQYTIKSFQAKNNDTILFYSDAIIEISSAPWNRMDDSLLRSELGKIGKNLATDTKNIMEFISKYSGSTILEDDLSIILMQIKEPLIVTIKLYLVDELEDFIIQLIQTLSLFDYNPDETQRITIAIRELVLNSIEHGNKNDSSKSVTINYRISCCDVEFKVKDEGSGFDENLNPDPTNFKRLEMLLNENNEKEYTHGRGIWLTRKLMGKLKYSEGGTLAIISRNKDTVYTYNNYKTPIDNK